MSTRSARRWHLQADVLPLLGVARCRCKGCHGPSRGRDEGSRPPPLRCRLRPSSTYRQHRHALTAGPGTPTPDGGSLWTGCHCQACPQRHDHARLPSETIGTECSQHVVRHSSRAVSPAPECGIPGALSLASWADRRPRDRRVPGEDTLKTRATAHTRRHSARNARLIALKYAQSKPTVESRFC